MATFPGSVPANIVTYNTATGTVESGGVTVSGIASYTLAQFNALTAGEEAALAGLAVHINDLHANAAGIGGVYFVRDASPPGWGQISPTIYYSSFAALPDAALWPGMLVTVMLYGRPCKMESRLVGSDYLWRFQGTSHIALCINADIAKSAPHTTEEILGQVALLRNTNTSKSAVAGQCIVQPGDLIRFSSAFGKAGVNHVTTMAVHHGTAGTSADTLIDGYATSGANQLSLSVKNDLQVRSATSIFPTGNNTTNPYSGTSSQALNTVDTGLTNIDTNATDTLLSFGYYLAGTTDTVPLLRNLTVELIHTV